MSIIRRPLKDFVAPETLHIPADAQLFFNDQGSEGNLLGLVVSGGTAKTPQATHFIFHSNSPDDADYGPVMQIDGRPLWLDAFTSYAVPGEKTAVRGRPMTLQEMIGRLPRVFGEGRQPKNWPTHKEESMEAAVDKTVQKNPGKTAEQIADEWHTSTFDDLISALPNGLRTALSRYRDELQLPPQPPSGQGSSRPSHKRF